MSYAERNKSKRASEQKKLKIQDTIEPQDELKYHPLTQTIEVKFFFSPSEKQNEWGKKSAKTEFIFIKMCECHADGYAQVNAYPNSHKMHETPAAN
jgi:hypothetical protein